MVNNAPLRLPEFISHRLDTAASDMLRVGKLSFDFSQPPTTTDVRSEERQ